MNQEQPEPTHVIVHTGYGSTDVFPATRENAMRFFDDYKTNLPAEVLEMAAADPKKIRYVSAQRVAEAIVDTYPLPAFQPAKKLRTVLHGWPRRDVPQDDRPEVLVEKNWAAEIARWITDHRLNLDRLAGSDVVDHNALVLSMFAPLLAGPRKAELVRYENLFEMADGYRTITQGRWKEGASEAAIARSILYFVDAYLVDKSNVRTLGVFPVVELQ